MKETNASGVESVVRRCTGELACPFQRIEHLYTLLYLDKYSTLNPQYSAQWLQRGHAEGWLELVKFVLILISCPPNSWNTRSNSVVAFWIAYHSTVYMTCSYIFLQMILALWV